MKKSNPAKILFSFLGLATFASLVGTVSGTLAWYTYSTRATVSYSGTSVTNTVQLQIGIASPTEVLSVQGIREQLDLVEDMEEEEKNTIISSFVEFWNVMEPANWNNSNYYDGAYYYFAPIGTGLTSPVINAYLKSNGYATNSLAAVTSGAFNRGDRLNLRTSPNPDHNQMKAYEGYYSTIPFAFRVIRTSTMEEGKYEPNIPLWLTDAQIRAYSENDGEIYKAVRIYVDRTENDDYILNPSASEPGSTIVAGALDLTRDNYYDYDSNGDEVIYGEYETIGERKPSYDGVDELVDLNKTGKTGDNFDTFTAKHRPGINYYDKADYQNEELFKFKRAYYESLDSIAPEKDPVTGELFDLDENNPTSLCTTKDETGHCLGRVDMTVYLEGWDHNVIDQEYEHAFDLGLTFEINKLGD